MSGRASASPLPDLDSPARIRAFLRDHWGRRQPPDQSFGSGNAARRFVEILQQPAFWVRPLQKEFHDN